MRDKTLADSHLFASFIQGGFECSTHRRKDGKRLDLIASTVHDQFLVQDYERLKERRHSNRTRGITLAPDRGCLAAFMTSHP